MNIHKLLISASLFLCVFLQACAPATTLAPAVTSLPPTNVPPMETPAIAVTIDLNKVSEITHEAETINVDFLNTRVPIPAFDSIWFLSDTQGKVTRWDPETRQVLATIQVSDPGKAPYGDPVSTVVTSDAIWITSVATHEIVKVDPQTNQIVDRITLPKVNGDQDFFTNNMVLVGNFSHINAISSLNGLLWISTMDDVAQINTATNDVIQRLPAGSPVPVVSAEGSMWGFNNAVYRMDSETYQVTA